MDVIFAGTPVFAARALDAIVAAGFHVPLVLTQPDRPAGRGRKLTQSAVRLLAAERSLDVYQPERLRSDEQQAPLLAVRADVMVVAAYGLILPQRILDHPRHGCLNIHASLLPRWRGAAPIQRAILAGDAETGVSIMQMEAGLDTGPVISMHRIAITGNDGNDADQGDDRADTAGTLHDKLAALGSGAIVAALVRLERDGRLHSTAQSEDGVTYAAKITADEARIDWSQSAATIARQVRAFDPAPGAFTTIGGTVLKIWSARAFRPEVATDAPAAGELASVNGALVAGCSDGALVLDEVQLAGSRRMNGAEWARGRPDLAAARLGS